MLRDLLIEKLSKAFGADAFKVAEEPLVTFHAKHPAVGQVQIWDDDPELIVGVGDITHGHFSVCDEGLTDEEVAGEVTDQVVDFLDRLFADKVILWRSEPGEAGGWKRLDVERNEAAREAEADLEKLLELYDLRQDAEYFVWSGPRQGGDSEGKVLQFKQPRRSSGVPLPPDRARARSKAGRIGSAAIVVLAAVLLVTGILDFFAPRASISALYEGPEARHWLKENPNEGALASNWFGGTESALEFVERLYAAGAEAVMISRECIDDGPEIVQWEGGPYADGLVVKLPKDKAGRKAVLKLCWEETEPGLRPVNPGGFEKDLHDDKLFLWWD